MPLYADNLEKRHHPSPMGGQGPDEQGKLAWSKPTLVAVPGDRALDPQTARTAKRFCMRDFFVGEYSRVLRIFLLRAHRPPAVLRRRAANKTKEKR